MPILRREMGAHLHYTQSVTPDSPTDTTLSPPIPHPGAALEQRRPALNSTLAKQTAQEGIALAMLNIVLLTVLTRLHLSLLLPGHENANAIKQLGKLSPALLFVIAVVIAPVIEESLFRGLPYLLNNFLQRFSIVPERTRPFLGCS